MTDHDEPERLDHLPDSFWAARPVLAHLHAAARSRMVGPDALFGAVLARVAATTPHVVALPAIVGRPVGLSLLAVIAGPANAGKSAAVAVAQELVPAPAGVLDLLPIGSGEGLAEVLHELVDEEGPDGKKSKVKLQTRFAAIVAVDEGQVVADLGNRKGSTLLPTLRTIFTHGTIGATNASAERRRSVRGENYVYGVTVNLQPELAGPLLADTVAGTPQRFIYLSALDPTLPDGPLEAWPGRLPWSPPTAYDIGRLELEDGPSVRRLLDVAPAIAHQVQTDRRDAMRGDTEPDPWSAHANLVRLKVAALLAILDDRLTVNPDDWTLAHTITDTSRHVRHTLARAVALDERRREEARNAGRVRTDAALEGSATTRALASAVRSIGRHVIRHHEVDGCTRRCLTQAIAGKHRAVVTVDEVIDRAIEDGLVALGHDGGYRPGRAHP